ncbi:MAG TPA: ATP-binding protein [Ignavibacteria bacterium]
MDFFLPTRVYSDFNGYDNIIDLFNDIEEFSDDEIVLDFIHTNWFEANLSAILGAICILYREQGKEVRVRNINQTIEDVLCRNHFLCEFNYYGFIDTKGTILTYQMFSPYQDIEFLKYIDNELLSKPDFPRHSKILGKKINESIFELFENARTHGNCKHIFTCGQYYPNKYKGKRLDITIVDLGITIKRNVNEYLQKELTGYEAIEWAMQYGNTTKRGNVSGGLGLDIVKAFINLNKGKIQIVSANGYWEFSNGRTFKNTFSNSFPGTIVNIEFNLNDKHSYQFKEEISLDNIF